MVVCQSACGSAGITANINIVASAYNLTQNKNNITYNGSQVYLVADLNAQNSKNRTNENRRTKLG